MLNPKHISVLLYKVLLLCNIINISSRHDQTQKVSTYVYKYYEIRLTLRYYQLCKELKHFENLFANSKYSSAVIRFSLFHCNYLTYA